MFSFISFIFGIIVGTGAFISIITITLCVNAKAEENETTDTDSITYEIEIIDHRKPKD